MEYKFLNKFGQRLRGPGKRLIITGSIALVVVLCVVAAIITNYAVSDKIHESPISFTRLKSTFSFIFLGHKPAFYYVDIEKNGKDFRLRKIDTFDVSYRDEFVVKNISTDIFHNRGVTIDVEGIGGADDFRVMLRGIELVDKTVINRGRTADTEVVDAGSISVKYHDEVIASIPMRVVLRPRIG